MKPNLTRLIAILSINAAYANASEQKDSSLCSAQETSYVSCTLENKKIVSLSAGKKRKKI